MRKSSTFRPRLIDSLEDRVVPSRAMPAAAVSPSPHAPLTPQQITASKVAGAYGNFVQSFTQDVNSDLLMPSVTGPSMTTPALFSEDLGVALTTLGKSVLKTLQQDHATAKSPAVKKIVQSINGSNRDSLRGQLTALEMATAQGGYSFQGFEAAAIEDVRQNFAHVHKEILGMSPSSTSTTPSTTTGGGATTY
jgi:hypothetical protein